MWSHLIKLVSLSKGALVVGVAASAAMVSNAAQFSNAPSHQELPSATPSALVSVAPTTKPSVESSTKLSDKPKTTEQPKANDSAKPELSGVLKECLTKYAAVRAAGDSASQGERQSASSVCKAAIEQSGLTSSEFAAKYGFDQFPTPANSSPKTEHKTVGLEAAIHQCLVDWRNYAEQNSTACHETLVASGLSAEDFWKKFEDWAVQQPQDADETTDVTALVKDCFAKYTAKDPGTLEACKKAMAASGLTGDDFWNKYGRPTPPSSAPKSTTNEETYQLVATCIKLRNSITSTADKKKVTAMTEACNKAFAATGLSYVEFWTKFGKELTNKPYAPKPATNTAELSQLVAKCLDLYKAITSTGDTKSVSDACGAAIKASGMSSSDFWAKYHPTTKTEPTASPTPATSTAELSQLIAKCVDLYKAMTSTGDTHAISEACGAAIRASGLSSNDFWAKYHPATN